MWVLKDGVIIRIPFKSKALHKYFDMARLYFPGNNLPNGSFLYKPASMQFKGKSYFNG